MDDKLARVRWQMGQTLLPEHLMAQEDSLLADSVLRFRLQGLPAFGIGSLALNDTLLDEGIFSIQEMTLVMGSGLLLDVPGNTTVSPFNLNVPGTTRLALYLHVLRDTGAPESAAGGWDEDEAANIPRVRYRLALASEQGYPEAIETLKLAEFAKSPEGLWTLSRGYIPPLMQLGTSPFLQKEFGALSEALEMFQYNLSLEAASHLSGESLFAAKQCLKGVYKVRRLLANLAGQVHLHPYLLYEALQILYTEVCFYRNATPENESDAYDHNQLCALTRVVDALTKQMQLVKTRPPYLPFELADNIYQVQLPEDVRQATDVYFLAQKSQVAASLSIEEMKLAAVNRLSFVHKMALHGITLKRIDRVPFQHPFGAEVEFYLIREGEEWDHALNEEKIAFFNRPDLKETNFYLYWRAG